MDYTKLEQWRKATQELATVKDLEMKLRKELFKEGFMAPVEGVNSIDLQDGWALKATVPYTRSLDQAKVEETLKALKKAKAPAALIKTKYELSLTEYKKLDDASRAIVDSIVTTKQGTPALELVAPKGQ